MQPGGSRLARSVLRGVGGRDRAPGRHIQRVRDRLPAWHGPVRWHAAVSGRARLSGRFGGEHLFDPRRHRARHDLPRFPACRVRIRGSVRNAGTGGAIRRIEITPGDFLRRDVRGNLKPGDYVVHAEITAWAAFWSCAPSSRARPRAITCCSNTRSAGQAACTCRSPTWIWSSVSGAQEKQRRSSTAWVAPLGAAQKRASKPGCAIWPRSCSEQLYAARKTGQRLCVFRRQQLAARIRRRAFEFTETRDQRSAIVDIKRDMENAEPMDRLLCGDVGYGKTEVVMRAAFKALGDGQTGRHPRPHHGACFPALRDLQTAVPAVPGARRDAQPVRSSQRAQTGGRRRGRSGKSISRSAPTGCCRRTWSSRTWVW